MKKQNKNMSDISCTISSLNLCNGIVKEDCIPEDRRTDKQTYLSVILAIESHPSQGRSNYEYSAASQRITE